MHDPVMLRAYNNGNTGATAFFRNRPFLDTFLRHLAENSSTQIRILVHACSVGAEPYSLVMWWRNRVPPAVKKKTELEVVATDIDGEFIEYAKQGSYPSTLMEGMSKTERSWFMRSGDQILIPPRYRKHVSFAPPCNFVADGIDGEFDAVLIMNALTYVTPDEQTATVAKVAAQARTLVGLTAFHPDSICSDVEAAGMRPLMTNHEEIHNAWGDRLSPAPVPPDSPDYAWRLSPYETDSADYAFRYGTLFERAPESD